MRARSVPFGDAVTVPLPLRLIEIVNKAAGAGFTVADTVTEAPLKVAVMGTFVGVLTREVAALKLTELEPAVTATVAGTVRALVLPLVSAIVAVPEETGMFIEIVPCTEAPPDTTVGLSVMDERANGGAGKICTKPLTDEPFRAPVNPIVVPAAGNGMAAAVMGKVAVMAPCGT